MVEVNCKGRSGFVSFCFCWGDKHRLLVAPDSAWWAHHSEGICSRFRGIQHMNSILYPLKGNNFSCLTKRNYCGTKYTLNFPEVNISILQGNSSLPRLRTLSHRDSRSSRARTALAFLWLCSARQDDSWRKNFSWPFLHPPVSPIHYIPPNSYFAGDFRWKFWYFYYPSSVNGHYSHDNYRKTRVEMRSGEGVNEGTLTRFDILFVQFFILHLVSSECSAMHSTIFP